MCHILPWVFVWMISLIILKSLFKPWCYQPFCQINQKLQFTSSLKKWTEQHVWYLFFSSSSLFAFFLWAGISCAKSSFISSLSFLAFTGESLVNWKVKLFPSWRTSCICTLELPSGLIRWTVGNNYTINYNIIRKYKLYMIYNNYIIP